MNDAISLWLACQAYERGLRRLLEDGEEREAAWHQQQEQEQQEQEDERDN